MTSPDGYTSAALHGLCHRPLRRIPTLEVWNVLAVENGTTHLEKVVPCARSATHLAARRLGGSAAARLAARLGMSTSGDTVLRELRRAGCPAPATPPVVIGIDDWAIKRGHRFVTLIVDLQTRRPIKVLGGRETTIVADWLQQHPTVEIVARDRADAYSDAARTASPGAQQVADRWHLLTNLREAVERLLVRRTASLREASRTLSEALRIEAQPVTAAAPPLCRLPSRPRRS